MDIKADVLQEALRSMVEFKGFTHREITLASGVHNIGRLIKGKQTPYAKTWEALRDAYPEHIPEVVYQDDKGRVFQVVNSHIIGDGNKNITTVSGPGVALSAKETTIIELLRQKDKDGTLANRILAILLQEP